MTRTAILGGEAQSRGLLGGGRSKRDNKIRYGFGAAAFFTWYLIGDLIGIVVAAAVGLVGVALTSQMLSGASVISTIVLHLRWLSRRRKRLTKFVPPYPADTGGAFADEVAIDVGSGESQIARTDNGVVQVPAGNTEGAAEAAAVAHDEKRAAKNKRKRSRKKKRKPIPVRSVPDGVGKIREMVYEAPAGGEVSVLVHTNPARKPYISAVLEVEGQATGLHEQEDIDAAAERFGRLLTACGGPTSLIRGIQVITRVVPVDSAEHEWYVLNNRSPMAPDRIIASYGELIGQARQSVEQFRNYVVAQIPITAAFAETAREFGDPGADEVRCAVVHHEMSRLAALAANCGMRPLRLLGPARLAALLRSLQDPDFFIDDVEDVTLENCWQHSTTEARYVLTNEKWATRIAQIPPHGVSLEPVHMRWLSPLLIGVQPSIIRTLSMLIQLEPATVARKQARMDVAEDRGRLMANAGKVTDLGEEGALIASSTRLRDLRAGTGHAGIRWGMYVAITAQESAIRRASDVILDRAGDAGLVDLHWLDKQHDIAQPTVWPLWRGLG